jgi:hypothetical protein
MLGDPNINLTVFVQNSNTAGILYAYEVCDACEDDSLGYQIDNILLSVSSTRRGLKVFGFHSVRSQ